jgi:abequosyltransferase
VRLSICIPTYNFGAFIGETLDAILHQLEAGVEIVVVDGASTDNTEAVVAARAHPGLRYVRLEKRGGIDVDVDLAAMEARGSHCWFFSADDAMRPGALAKVLSRLNDDVDVLLCRHSNCDLNLAYLGDHPVSVLRAEQDLDLATATERRQWLASAETTEALFSFISCVVVRLDTWRSVPPVERFMRSCWGHVARLLEASRANGRLRLRYLPHVLVDKRGENDSFLSGGYVNRVRIAVDGFSSLAANFFGAGSPEYCEVLRLLRRELAFSFLLDVRRRALANPEREDVKELDRLVGILYADGAADRMRHIVYQHCPIALYGIAVGLARARYHAWGFFKRERRRLSEAISSNRV